MIKQRTKSKITGLMCSGKESMIIFPWYMQYEGDLSDIELEERYCEKGLGFYKNVQEVREHIADINKRYDEAAFRYPEDFDAFISEVESDPKKYLGKKHFTNAEWDEIHNEMQRHADEIMSEYNCV